MNKLLEYLGILLLLGGIAGTAYFFHFFNTVVTTQPVTILGQSYGGGEQVNNLGLMADRQNGMIASVGAAILGAILVVAGHSLTTKADNEYARAVAQTQESPYLCPDCGKYFAGQTAFCPHCGKPQRYA